MVAFVWWELPLVFAVLLVIGGVIQKLTDWHDAYVEQQRQRRR